MKANLMTKIYLVFIAYAEERRREWDSNPCGPEDPRALKARALTTLPSRHHSATLYSLCILNVYRIDLINSILTPRYTLKLTVAG